MPISKSDWFFLENLRSVASFYLLPDFASVRYPTLRSNAADVPLE
jgi:hypothetical protein